MAIDPYYDHLFFPRPKREPVWIIDRPNTGNTDLDEYLEPLIPKLQKMFYRIGRLSPPPKLLLPVHELDPDMIELVEHTTVMALPVEVAEVKRPMVVFEL